MKHFESETFTVQYAGRAEAVDGLSGWRCEACGEIEFEVVSAQRYAARRAGRFRGLLVTRNSSPSRFCR